MNPKPDEQIKLEVWGPDGIPISPEPFNSIEAAARGLAWFVLVYAGPGFYKNSKGVRIPVFELPSHCTVRMEGDDE